MEWVCMMREAGERVLFWWDKNLSKGFQQDREGIHEVQATQGVLDFHTWCEWVMAQCETLLEQEFCFVLS